MNQNLRSVSRCDPYSMSSWKIVVISPSAGATSSPTSGSIAIPFPITPEEKLGLVLHSMAVLYPLKDF